MMQSNPLGTEAIGPTDVLKADMASALDGRSSLLRLNKEKAAAVGLGVLIAYAFVRNLIAAASRPFWYDELCTWALAHLQSASALWGALDHAADGNPPVFYLIERAVIGLIRNEEIAFRIPSMIGFLCVL